MVLLGCGTDDYALEHAELVSDQPVYLKKALRDVTDWPDYPMV